MTGSRNRRRTRSMLDTELFSRLYDETHRDLLAFLLRRCPTAEDAADVLWEPSRIAWEKRSHLPAGDDARPWLLGVAKNVAQRERAQDQQQTAIVQQLALAIEQASAPTHRQNASVRAALSELSPLDRDIVLMLSVGDMTPREVASIVTLSPNAVRIRAHRARARLRTLLSSPSPSCETLNSTAPALEGENDARRTSMAGQPVGPSTMLRSLTPTKIRRS